MSRRRLTRTAVAGASVLQSTALDLAVAHRRRPELLCIGAHCDDIEIGCGGTILSALAANADARVHWFVLTSTPQRKREAVAAMRDLVPAKSLGLLRIASLDDGRLPAQFADVKAEFERVKKSVDPTLVLTHYADDLHQDHALVSAVTLQTFRTHRILEYEVLKYDGDLGRPNCYVPVSETAAKRKLDVIGRHFVTQRRKTWFDERNFTALMRVRGVECRSPSGLAEAFYVRKFTLQV